MVCHVIVFANKLDLVCIVVCVAICLWKCTTLLLKGGSYAQAFSMAVGVGHVVLASGSSVPVADRLATGESAGSSAWTEPYGTWSLPFLFMTTIWMVSVKAIAQQCRQHVQPAVS